MVQIPKLKRVMIITASIILILIIAGFAFMQHPMFGEIPKGERLERIKKSPNYENGKFRNVEFTPDLTEGTTLFSVIYKFIFQKNERGAPVDRMPSIKSNIIDMESKQDILIWFGHSSYFIQVDGKRILVDPVFSGSSSPLPYSVKAFEGTDIYTADDFREIDYLFITHDHWDHCDYKTLKELRTKVKSVICALGVGQHLERWGYDKNKIIESDWNEQVILDNGFIVNTVTARHFSGRRFTRNKSLWVSFVLRTPTMNIFIGGDSGYGSHFAEIGKRFGEFDIAILENGQYDNQWKYIHMMPEEVLQAALDLRAKKLLPVHSSKFKLSKHSWDESLNRISKLSEGGDISLITPMIGEQVNLKDTAHIFTKWWAGVN